MTMNRILGALLLAAAPVAAQGRPAAEHPMQLAAVGGVLHGTLLVPQTAGPHPVALLIAGSGPTDRNGNSRGLGPNDSLRKLAEALAAEGIASVRYDKRGIGESGAAATAEGDLRFEHYAEDAAGWIRHLHEDGRFSSVTVIGHSEGSLVGMLAARAAGADRFVSLAGAGRPIGQVLRDQLQTRLPPQLYAQADTILASLEAGQMREGPPMLAALFRPSVQPYMISWLRYDPAQEIARLQVPVLIVQGTTDIQVGVSEAERLHRAASGSRLVVIDGMNHVLKEVPADQAQQIASYSDPSLPLAAGLVQAIVELIR